MPAGPGTPSPAPTSAAAPAPPDSQASAPYLEAVIGFARREPARFHVPGHKGGSGADPEARSELGEGTFFFDLPQDIEGIDVGPSPTPSERAELLAAEAYGAAQSWFLTNGATQGNHALCLALAREQPVVVQRNSHASVVDGLVLSGGRPHFAVPEYDEQLGMALCVTPRALADALDRASDAGAVFMVSPTYYGATADVSACAQVCHERGAALLVDQAWGPHFGFGPEVPASALTLGADAMLTSTHKIVGSLTQSAMLHVGASPWVDRDKLARAVRLVRSTSPSSLLLASLDAARRQLAVHGPELLAGTLERAAAVRQEIERVPGCRIVPEAHGHWSSVAAWDPMRVVVDLRATGASGHAVAAALRHPTHRPVQVELATHATIVLVLGINEPAQPLGDFPARLAASLAELTGPSRESPVARAPQPLSGEPSLTPRGAWLAGTQHVPVRDSIGRVSAEAIAGYPPGIPVLMPGERVTVEVVEHLRELVTAGVRLHGASDPRLDTMAIVSDEPAGVRSTRRRRHAAIDPVSVPDAEGGAARGVAPMAPLAPEAGLRMPAEWEPHERCLMAWPARAELWGERLTQARGDYGEIARAIARYEPVLMFARPQDVAEAAELCGEGVTVLACPLDDSWMRDTGPLFVRDAGGALSGVDFAFNGWGGKYEPHDADAAIARRVLEQLGFARHQAPCVLEGGAVSVDGEGTLVTTESVLLHPSRNPGLSREDLEGLLLRYLGAEKVIWLTAGLVEDRDTDGHVDNVCHFVGPATVLVQTVTDPANPNYAICRENVRRLRGARDARGRALELIELPLLPYLPGRSPKVVAPYLNFYLANGAVVVPVTGEREEARALELIGAALPGRDVVPVPGATLAIGGGGVHCITQQQPASLASAGPVAAAEQSALRSDS